jgi:hypothetical protein
MQLLEQRPATAYPVAAPSTSESVRQEVLTETKAGKKVTASQVREGGDSRHEDRSQRRHVAATAQPETRTDRGHRARALRGQTAIAEPLSPRTAADLMRWLRTAPLDEIVASIVDAIDPTRLAAILDAINAEVDRREAADDLEAWMRTYTCAVLGCGELRVRSSAASRRSSVPTAGADQARDSFRGR